MFCVLFEVHPKADQWDTYLGFARVLKPELERIDGFIENIRYRSLTRAGWILSLSVWRDEKSLVRWRTQARHHEVQDTGRRQVFVDYHLRVGELTHDTRPSPQTSLQDQRRDETEAGAATTVSLITASQEPAWPITSGVTAIARVLGLRSEAPGLVAWDVFDAVLTPGDAILLLSWRDRDAAAAGESTAVIPAGARMRRVRVIRDYGMFDRREAPQYYPQVE